MTDKTEIIGISTHIQEVRQTIKTLAKEDSTVLILGPTGTGKELVANNIHWSSKRNKGPFVAVNCAAIPDGLLESELFGHEKGAFTGATEKKVGKFELANSGTILLDEIGDMKTDHQTKILRVLQEGGIWPVGGKRERKIDVRVIASTNKDLPSEIAKGCFRQDLYYRLALGIIRLKPLSERPEDVVMLTNHFIDEYKLRRKVDPRVKFLLYAYNWPGNVRELQSMVRHINDFSYVRSELERVWNSTPKENSEANTKELMELFKNEPISEKEQDRFVETIEFLGKTGIDFNKHVEIYEIITLNWHHVSKDKICKFLHLRRDKVFNFRGSYGFELDLKEDQYLVFHPLDVYPPPPKTLRNAYPFLLSPAT